VRRAKEMLFTADFVGAEDAHRLGMVNHVVGGAELEASTLRLAQRIAAKPSFPLKLAKEAVNGAQDARRSRRRRAGSVTMQQLCHAHNMAAHGMLIDPCGLMSEAVPFSAAKGRRPTDEVRGRGACEPGDLRHSGGAALDHAQRAVHQDDGALLIDDLVAKARDAAVGLARRPELADAGTQSIGNSNAFSSRQAPG
jgi:hypothetical protein